MSDAFSQALDRLSRISGVRGALIVEADTGLPVVSELKTDVHGGAVAALAASLYSRTGRATETADFGGLRTMQLEADAGHVVVAGAGDLLVVVITERSAQLGMVRVEVHRAAEALK